MPNTNATNEQQHGITVHWPVQLPITDIADTLANNLRPEQLFDLMVRLDEAVADYEFSVRLRDHLSALIEAEDAAGNGGDSPAGV